MRNISEKRGVFSASRGDKLAMHDTTGTLTLSAPVRLGFAYRDEQHDTLSVLSPAICGLVVFWGLIPVLTPVGVSPEGSLTATTISALLGLGACLGLLRRSRILGPQFVFLGLVLFLMRCALGVWHYVTFFDSHYFMTQMPSYGYLHDYEWLNDEFTLIAEHWRMNGFSSLPEDLLGQKNTFLMPYFALLYYLEGNEHFLNFTALNSLHASLVAALIARFAYMIGGRASAQAVFVIALLQPFGFISSILWRDSVGQFFLIAGALILILTPLTIKGVPMIIIGAISLMTLRNIYFLNGMITTASKILSARTRSGFVMIAGAISFVVLVVVFQNYIQENVLVYDLSSNDFTYNKDIATITYNFVRGLTGPFPWTQVLDPQTVGREYQIPDILQAAFNLTILLFLCRRFASHALDFASPITLPTLAFVFSIMGEGLVGFGHTSYVTVASVLALPLIPRLSPGHFTGAFSAVVGLLLISGLIWSTLGLGGG